MLEEKLYDRIIEWCERAGRKAPARSDKKGIENTLKSMRMLG